MATPTYTWSDVINQFITAVQNVLYEVGKFIVDNAAVIAQAMLGIGLAVAIYRLAGRAVPWVRSLFARLV